MDGSVRSGMPFKFVVANQSFSAGEVGIFSPAEKAIDVLSAGEIGYIVTGVKSPGIASVGDTITGTTRPLPAFGGYQRAKPVVWASLYPESQDDFPNLRQALARLQLSDSALAFEEETSGTLGRGFRCGFLGMLHMEIITERLHREFDLDLIITSPSITYDVELINGKKERIYSPVFFSDDGQIKNVNEPWVKAKIILPNTFVGAIIQLLHNHEAEIGETETFGDASTYAHDGRTMLTLSMPLREMMRGFFDEVKSVSSGYASVSYEIEDSRPADVTRLDILVADEVVPAFSRVVARRRVEDEAQKTVKKLAEAMPRQCS